MKNFPPGQADLCPELHSEMERLSAAVRKLQAACEAAVYEVDSTDVHIQLKAALEETKEFDA
jgi:hypothetical protein